MGRPVSGRLFFNEILKGKSPALSYLCPLKNKRNE